MRFHERLVITRSRATTGSTDQATGAYTGSPGGVESVYDGPADVQDEPQRRRRDETGRPVGPPGLTVFLPPRAALGVLGAIRQDDAVAITYQDGAVRVGRVDAVTRLDQSLLVWPAT